MTSTQTRTYGRLSGRRLGSIRLREWRISWIQHQRKEGAHILAGTPVLTTDDYSLVIMERPAADSQMSRVTLRRGESSGAEPHTKGTGRSCLKYCLLVWMSMPRRLPWRSPNKPVKYVR